MKLKKGFIVYNKNGESLLVPTAEAEFSGLVQGNKTLGAVLELLKEDTTEGIVISELKDKYDVSDETAERDVKNVIEKLREIGAIDE